MPMGTGLVSVLPMRIPPTLRRWLSVLWHLPITTSPSWGMPLRVTTGPPSRFLNCLPSCGPWCLGVIPCLSRSWLLGGLILRPPLIPILMMVMVSSDLIRLRLSPEDSDIVTAIQEIHREEGRPSSLTAVFVHAVRCYHRHLLDHRDCGIDETDWGIK